MRHSLRRARRLSVILLPISAFAQAAPNPCLEGLLALRNVSSSTRDLNVEDSVKEYVCGQVHVIRSSDDRQKADAIIPTDAGTVPIGGSASEQNASDNLTSFCSNSQRHFKLQDAGRAFQAVMPTGTGNQAYETFVNCMSLQTGLVSSAKRRGIFEVDRNKNGNTWTVDVALSKDIVMYQGVAKVHIAGVQVSGGTVTPPFDRAKGGDIGLAPVTFLVTPSGAAPAVLTLTTADGQSATIIIPGADARRIIAEMTVTHDQPATATKLPAPYKIRHLFFQMKDGLRDTTIRLYGFRFGPATATCLITRAGVTDAPCGCLPCSGWAADAGAQTTADSTGIFVHGSSKTTPETFFDIEAPLFTFTPETVVTELPVALSCADQVPLNLAPRVQATITIRFLDDGGAILATRTMLLGQPKPSDPLAIVNHGPGSGHVDTYVLQLKATDKCAVAGS